AARDARGDHRARQGEGLTGRGDVPELPGVREPVEPPQLREPPRQVPRLQVGPLEVIAVAAGEPVRGLIPVVRVDLEVFPEDDAPEERLLQTLGELAVAAAPVGEVAGEVLVDLRL